jgi:ribosome modulation factor
VPPSGACAIAGAAAGSEGGQSQICPHLRATRDRWQGGWEPIAQPGPSA